MQETDLTTHQEISNKLAARKRGWNHYGLYAISAGVIILDQLVKYWTEQNLGPPNSGRSIELLGGFFRLIYIQNSGASFGMLKGVPWLFALLAIGASLGIIGWYETRGLPGKGWRVGIGLILGGVVGNLCDRLFKGGSVTDMLNFPNIELFKIFNVADSAITFGVIVVILSTLLQTRKQSV